MLHFCHEVIRWEYSRHQFHQMRWKITVHSPIMKLLSAFALLFQENYQTPLAIVSWAKWCPFLFKINLKISLDIRKHNLKRSSSQVFQTLWNHLQFRSNCLTYLFCSTYRFPYKQIKAQHIVINKFCLCLRRYQSYLPDAKK